MKRLAIITTHPIQYNAPLFREMAKTGLFQVKVFYTWGSSVLEDKFDPGFGKKIQWDINLLEGYDYEFEQNISSNPGSHSYKGINNPELINNIKLWGASAILVYGWKFKAHLQAIKYFHNKIPVLFRGDSTLLDKISPVKNILRKLTLNYVYKNVDYFLYVGSANKEYFKMAGAKEEQLLYAPHAIDLSFFKKAFEKPLLRTKLEIPQDALVFLFAGKLDENKNPLLLVKAFLAYANQNSYLIIAGDGKLKESVLKACEGFTNIQILPFQNQMAMPNLYHAANVYVMPSMSETWGLAVNEAMACGCVPLISTGCGCADDLIIQNETGFVFTKNSEASLGYFINWFQNNKSKLNQFSDKSNAHVLKFNYSKAIEAIDSIFTTNV